MVEAHRSGLYLSLMNSVHLGNNYLWISYETLILPIQLDGFTQSGNPGLLLGIIAFIGISLGVFFSIFAGVLSDKKSILWGRRSPYIVFGSLFTGLVMVLNLFPTSSVIAIFVIFVAMQIGSNISSGAYQPLLRDLVVQDQRGTSAGINGIFTLIGTAMGIGITGFLISDGEYGIAVSAMLIVVVVTAIVTGITIRKDDKPVPSDYKGLKETLVEVFSPKNKAPGFFILVAGSFPFFLAITGLSFFEYYYFTLVLGSTDPSELVAISGIVVLIFSSIGAIIFGYISDRHGRFWILVFAAALGGAATAIIPTVHSFMSFVILGSFIGIGYGSFFTVSKALASDMAPVEDAGKYMAYYNIAVGGSSAFSTLFYGSVLGFFGQSYDLGFTVLFELSASFYAVSLMILILLKKQPGVR